jgi:uncharacterized protein
MEPFPMFPLGSVLFPHALLPLHVFEPRYRALTQHCLEQDREFGVVLIERGSEVGGGDTRFSVGTSARIVRAGELDDGRWLLVARGTERLRVRDWLPDDPYPRAVVEPLGERAGADGVTTVAEVEALLRRVQALRAELGDPAAGVDVTLADDPIQASFEAAALAGLGPLDAQRLLEADDAGERLTGLADALGEAVAVLEFRLSPGA